MEDNGYFKVEMLAVALSKIHDMEQDQKAPLHWYQKNAVINSYCGTNYPVDPDWNNCF